MSKSKEPAAPNQSVTISLNDIGVKYLTSLQRIYDITTFSMASARLINETNYDEFARTLQVMPNASTRMNFDRAKEEAERWLFRNSLTDALSIVIPLLEDCRTVCALARWKVSKERKDADLQKITVDDRTAFLRMTLRDKFKHLKDVFGLASELESNIESLARTRACLAQEGGKVGERATGADEEDLVLRLKTVQFINTPVTGQNQEVSLNVSRQFAEIEKTFKKGEAIELSKMEQAAAIITITIFVTNLLEGVQKFVKDSGAADQPA
ncbi:MAG: hypothetical protein SFY92_00045 [Verrucomicrobiae bacterium]|nr:hypothetical protein [Verrucomicrobiae bacterium]